MADGRRFEASTGDFTHTRLLPPPVAVVLHYESACLEHWRRKYVGYARTVAAGRKQRFVFDFYVASLEACLRFVRAEEAGGASEVAEAEAAMMDTWRRWKLEPADLPERSQRGKSVQVMSERGVTLLRTGVAAGTLPNGAREPLSAREGCARPSAVMTTRMTRATTTWRRRLRR